MTYNRVWKHIKPEGLNIQSFGIETHVKLLESPLFVISEKTMRKYTVNFLIKKSEFIKFTYRGRNERIEFQI